jgi:F-type H+-transporting ATPase subunit f
MQRVVSFYEKLPRGPAPEIKAKGLLGRYQARYMGAKPSAARKETLLRRRKCVRT